MDNLNFTTSLPDAKWPSRHSNDSVGYDLFTPKQICLNPGELLAVDIGIIFELDLKYYGKIEEKSRLAKDYQISVHGGVLDPGFRGNVIVLIKNDGKDIMFFSKHDPIAQVVFHECITPKLTYVDHVSTDTERGTRGFGKE